MIQVPVPEAVGPTVEVELETDQRGVSEDEEEEEEEEVVGMTTEVVVMGSTVVLVRAGQLVKVGLHWVRVRVRVVVEVRVVVWASGA